ncbi:MAG: addiction module protein [Desulfobacterales bacterium]|nr:addiction module protein [Desulfobacterales bacterium]
MWNYRVVRKKNIYFDHSKEDERVDYTYAIYEAYYDNNGYVGAITQDPVEPFGENIEELRHSWVMMAEAFGKPILDYDNIPEPGYERKEDPIGSELDKRIKEAESGKMKGIPWEQVKRNLEEKWGPFDEAAYRKQVEAERLEKERYHSEVFVGIPEFEELIKKIYTDYREDTLRDIAENPWKYKEKND